MQNAKPMMSGPIQVELEGRGSLTLTDSHYLATGGEGSVYKANATIIKLYTDPHKMQRDGMPEKLKLLKGINHPGIVAPQGLVADSRGRPIGFYMPVAPGESLAAAITSGFGPKDNVTAVEKMREVVLAAHSHQAVMVDPNQLNWRVQHPTPQGPFPRVIDVDSWAIGRWKSNMVMESIRDWHTKGFSEKSDWFSWAIVTFQLFTGIHPYKGKLNGYKPGEWEARMKANASVFSPGVIMPASVRAFSTIPGPLLDWYNATFQKGERTPPPSALATGKAAAAAQVHRAVLTATGRITFSKLFGLPGHPVVRIWSSGAVQIDTGDVFDLSTKRRLGKMPLDGEVAPTEKGWLLGYIENDRPQLTYADGKSETPLTIVAAFHKLFNAGNRLYGVGEGAITEIKVHDFGKPVISLGKRWSLPTGSTFWGENIAVANTLGAVHLFLPQPDGKVYQLRAKDLEGLTVVAAKAGNRFAAVMAINAQGEYVKREFTFPPDYRDYVLWRGKSDTPDINLAILPKGVVATTTDDGELTVFGLNGPPTKVKDKDVTTDHILTNWEDKVVYLKNGEVWRLSLT